MGLFARSFFIVVLVSCAAASQVTTVPLKRLYNASASHEDVLEADRTRAAFFLSGQTGTAPITNVAYSAYLLSLGVGSPATYYNVIVDTGSSNTFVGTDKTKYKKTSTSIPTGNSVTVGYADGFVAGPEYLDRVTVAPGLVIHNQQIGNATSSATFEGVDGIIGLGPVDLTAGTIDGNIWGVIPTVMNNLASQKLIEKQVLGIFFAPANRESDKNGALTFGGADTSLYNGRIKYTPLTQTYPSSSYWGINTTITYGNVTLIHNSAGIIDTGTTTILFAEKAFDQYARKIPGAKLDSKTGILRIPRSSVRLMEPLKFTIGDTVFVLDVDAQLVPASLSNASDTRRWSNIGNLGSFGGRGLEFIFGQKLLERFYSVYDADLNRFGLAKTKYTNSKA